MPPVAEQDAPTGDRVLVSQPETSALFMATRSNLRLVKKSVRAIRNELGEMVDQSPGERIEFQEGVLRVPLDPKATIRLATGAPAKAGPILEWLEGHKLNGDWHDGFWRVDPSAPPISQDEATTLQEMALNLDAEGLEAFIEQEQAGWARAQLLDIARGTLDRVAAKQAEHEQALKSAREAGEAAAKKA